MRHLICCAAVVVATGASAATPGATENFQTGLNGWGSNSSAVSLEATGGADGPADGFARVENTQLVQLLIRASFTDTPAFTGDFTAAGITQISFAINELAIDDALSIRFGFGALGNFWVTDQAFDPQADTWETYTIDLIESNFTEVFDAGGTFAQAMGNVQRIQIRHDDAPIGIMPDSAIGDFGVDSITLIPTPGTAGLLALAGASALLRRRR